MAQINWKVAIIGIVVLAIMMAGGVVVYLHFNKDPHKLYTQGQEMLEAVINESNRLIEQDNYTEDDITRMKTEYKEAQYKFGGAYDSTKDTDFKVKILFDLVDYHNIDNPFHTGDWRKATACLQTILTLDKKNIEANKRLLDDMLLTANSLTEIGSNVDTQIWKNIQDYSTELISISQELGQKPEPYVQISKARSMLMIAKSGQTTNKESLLNEVIAQLDSLQQTYPADAQIYEYRSQAEALMASINESKGMLNAAEKAKETQQAILQAAIEANPDSSKAYINFLNAKLTGSQAIEGQYENLEADYIALTNQFPNDPEVYRALSSYYNVKFTTVDKAIDSLNKAIQLKPQFIRYYVELANSCLRKGTAFNDIAALELAAQVASQALTLPDAQEVKGPRESANKINRFELYGLLAMSSFEVAFASEGQVRQEWASTLAQTVHQLNQFYGDEKHPTAMKWNGMLKIAQEDYEAGSLELYQAYQQFRSTATVSTSGKYIHAELRYLPYVLARVYKNKKEVGLYKQFLEDALSNNIFVLAPDALLDYSEVLIRARQYTDAVTIIQGYQKQIPNNPQANALLLKAYVGSKPA